MGVATRDIALMAKTPPSKKARKTARKQRPQQAPDFSAYDLSQLESIQQDLRRTFVGKVIDNLLPLREQHRALMAQIERAVEPHGLTAVEFLGLTRKELERRMLQHMRRSGPAGRKGVRYVHPTDRSLVWHGFGKRPKWLHELVASGHDLASLRVEDDD